MEFPAPAPAPPDAATLRLLLQGGYRSGRRTHRSRADWLPWRLPESGGRSGLRYPDSGQPAGLPTPPPWWAPAAEAARYALGVKRSMTRYGTSTSGTRTDPSAAWLFSRSAMMVRGKATPDALRVCTNSGLAFGCGRKRM